MQAHSTRPSTLVDRVLDKALWLMRWRLPYNRLTDNLYHRMLFYRKHHRLPSHELLWNDMWFQVKATREIEDPLRCFVSDKELVKQYVRDTIGDEYNVPTLAVLRTPAEVDAYDFPPNCCIKPTHASSHVVLRVDGGPVDRALIKSWFALNYYKVGRERNYLALEPKVIVEPLIFGTTHVEDFKFFCWRSVPKVVQQDFDRHTHHTRKFFDADWNEQDFSTIYPRLTRPTPRPASLPRMLEVAHALSAPFSLVRIDLYTDDEQVLVGEITNCSANAGDFFLPRSAERKASELMFG